MVMPLVEKFWNWVSDIVHSASDFVRKWYTGNGQTYAYQVVLFVVVVYFFTMGGM